MGSRGTFVLCTARSRCMRIDAAERRSGEGPSIDSTSVDRMQSVPSAVRQASPSLSPARDRFQYARAESRSVLGKKRGASPLDYFCSHDVARALIHFRS